MLGGKGFFSPGGWMGEVGGKMVWIQLPLGLAHVCLEERQLYMAPCQVTDTFFSPAKSIKVGGVLFSGKTSVWRSSDPRWGSKKLCLIGEFEEVLFVVRATFCLNR